MYGMVMLMALQSAEYTNKLQVGHEWGMYARHNSPTTACLPPDAYMEIFVMEKFHSCDFNALRSFEKNACIQTYGNCMMHVRAVVHTFLLANPGTLRYLYCPTPASGQSTG